MTAGNEEHPVRSSLNSATIDLAIRLGLLGLLGYWSLKIITPFLTIVLWSAILAVALYPLFDWLAGWIGHRRLAAALVTLLSLMVVAGPITWLGFGLVAGVGSLSSGLDAGQLSIPLPDESVRRWPLVGEGLHHIWTLAATNIKEALVEVAPKLKPVGGMLLGLVQSAFFGLLEVLVAIVISGFLFTRGPQLVGGLSALLGRVLSHRGKEMVQLTGATIRNVSRGVVGIAFLQAILAGAGLLLAGIPAASVLAFLALILGVLQIGPTILLLPIVVWSWITMETIRAVIFSAYMIPVCLIDNILRPILIGRGLTTPMPVMIIGVMGGTLAYGIVGVFFGPVVLSVAWALLVAWLQEDVAVAGSDPSQ